MTSPAPVGVSSGAVSLVAAVEDLRVHFQTKAGIVHAVDGVSFTIEDGETLGLVGETGCGKSVTARSFIGLIATPPGIWAGGKINFWSREARAHRSPPVDLLGLSPAQMNKIRGNRIAMIFQDPAKSLNPAMPIREQVAEVFYQHRADDLLAGFGGRESLLVSRAAHQTSSSMERVLSRIPPWRSGRKRLKARVDELVAEALAETQIPNPKKVMRSYPHELSGGMKQRVMIAQALACNPDLLIADEPTTALDVTIQARILELIRELQQRRQTSVLYISHDLSLVKRICDRVAVMYAGRIGEIGQTDTVFRNPLHPYTRGLMAAVPSVGQRRGRLAAIEGTVPELIDPSPACRFHTRCAFAADICRRLDPLPRPYGEAGQSVACFAYEDPAPYGTDSASMPSIGTVTR